MSETALGKRYTCSNGGAQFLVTRPGQLPQCCGSDLVRL